MKIEFHARWSEADDILPERQHKALALVLAHAVTLHPDGTASVQSGQQTYTLAPGTRPAR